MQLLLPNEIITRLSDALRRAGINEIGGILMGEHVDEGTFRVKEITIQRQGGSFAAFLRVIQDITEPLRSFFRTTGHNYTRFNYLGEWHSHPSFVPSPSSKDHESMKEIIDDPSVGAHFVVLLIVKLLADGEVGGSVTVYQPGGCVYTGQLVFENI